MRVIPVLDVRGGIAVGANGGERRGYLPLRSVLADGSEPLLLARACRARLGTAELYVADLDAISSAEAGLAGRVGEAAGPPDECSPAQPWDAAPRSAGEARLRPASRLVSALASEGSAVWIDAGAWSLRAVRSLLRAGADRVVVGLETLPGIEALHPLGETFGGDRLAFSLDLRGERPVTRAPGVAALPPERIAEAAAQAGFTDIVVLDLDRVGRGAGPPLGLLRRLATAVRGARFLAGGGVRDARDLLDADRAGCAGCLVGTAIHEGRMRRSAVAHDARQRQAAPMSAPDTRP